MLVESGHMRQRLRRFDDVLDPTGRCRMVACRCLTCRPIGGEITVEPRYKPKILPGTFRGYY